MKINGSLLHTYVICPRKTWLLSRQITGDQYNEFLAIGRLLSEESYKREKKEINFGDNKIDFIKKDNDSLIIAETKKSSKMLKASEAQLLFYLYSYKNKIRNVKGEIRIPKEKKVIDVELTDEKIVYIEGLIEEINSIVDKELAPLKKRIKACRSCSYLEFCWS